MTCTYTDLKAEIYKWVDEAGKPHFGDRPPANTNTKEIGSTLNRLNLSTDLADKNMLIEAEKQRRQAGQSNSQARAIAETQNTALQWCKAARVRLNKLRGRVVFLDGNGKALKVSERERQQREAKLAKEIDEKC